MGSHAYSEKALVEEAAMEVLTALGWKAVAASDETFGPGGTFGRSSQREVVLPARVRAALVRLNPDAPATAIDWP